MASFYCYQNPVDNHSEVQIAKAPICIRKINPEGFLLWISQIGTSSPHLCLPCLFRLTALRTSYVLCVACLFRRIALKTSYFMCSVFVSTQRFKNDRAYTRVGLLMLPVQSPKIFAECRPYIFVFYFLPHQGSHNKPYPDEWHVAVSRSNEVVPLPRKDGYGRLSWSMERLITLPLAADWRGK